MKNSTPLIVLGCLLASLQVVNSIECYRCISHSLSNRNTACEDPIVKSSSNVGRCTGSQCYKVVQTGSFAGVTVSSVDRDCGAIFGGSPNTCVELSQEIEINNSTVELSVEICHCSTERCNGGHIDRKMSAILFVSASALFMFVSLFWNEYTMQFMQK